MNALFVAFICFCPWFLCSVGFWCVWILIIAISLWGVQNCHNEFGIRCWWKDWEISNFVSGWEVYHSLFFFLYMHVCDFVWDLVFKLWWLIKSDALNLWIRYEKYHVCYGGQEEERKANYTDMVRYISILNLQPTWLSARTVP